MNDFTATSTAAPSLETGHDLIHSNGFGNPDGDSLIIEDGSGFELGHAELATPDTLVLGRSSPPTDDHSHCECYNAKGTCQSPAEIFVAGNCRKFVKD
jgi:hypothetical protein